MKRTLAVAIVLAGLSTLVISSCATLMKGQNEDVALNASEDHARVTINGEDMGYAPVRLRLASNKTYHIEFAKPGFEKKVVTITNTIGAGYIIADVLLGLVPIIIDAATGSWCQLDQTAVNAALERQQ